MRAFLVIFLSLSAAAMADCKKSPLKALLASKNAPQNCAIDEELTSLGPID